MNIVFINISNLKLDGGTQLSIMIKKLPSTVLFVEGKFSQQSKEKLLVRECKLLDFCHRV
jgi:hypothetical protein